ncbi:MAG: CHAD domain-containing protein [Acidobacteriaceae bacterium]
MTSKNAAAKEQDSSHVSAPFAVPAKAFNLAIEECVRSANPDSVHRVRTGSRRLQALVEALLRQKPTLGDAAKGWLRPLKQVRRAAGAVRDLDVHRKLLERWLGKDSPLSQPHVNPLAKQAERLDDWLSKRRKHLAHGMVKQIRKREQLLAEAQAGFLAANDSATRTVLKIPRSSATVALEDFVRAVDRMPVLHAENLHDFRKATKKARYLAESGGAGEIDGSVAKALKRVQDTIGEWHDWLCLQQEARTALGEDAPELNVFLDREVERHFILAMKTTQVMRARLTGEWMAIQAPRPKRQPASHSVTDERLASGF